MAGSRFRALARCLRLFGRWVMTYLATAALLVLTLAVAFAAIGKSVPTSEDDSARLPALIRALQAVPGDVDDELLVEATFTAEELPAGEVQAIFYRITLPPGANLPSLTVPFCAYQTSRVTAGVGTEVVQSGAYGLLLDTPIRVQREGASRMTEEIPAGTEVILGQGDAASYRDYTGKGAIRNAGDESAVIIGVAIVSTDGWGVPAPELPLGVMAEQLTTTGPSDWRALPPGRLTVSLWRLRLPNDTSVGPYAAAGLEALWIESGTIARRFLRLSESTPRPLQLVHRAETAAIFIAPAPGIRRSIASMGGDPAVLLALSIEPETIWSATLAP